MPYDTLFERRDGLLRVEVSGDRGDGNHVPNADEVGKKIVQECRDAGIDRVLLVLHLTGRATAFEQFRTVINSIRYGWSREFKLAVVDTNRETVADTRFVETVAVNRVFNVRTFATEEQAAQWLDSFD